MTEKRVRAIVASALLGGVAAGVGGTRALSSPAGPDTQREICDLKVSQAQLKAEQECQRAFRGDVQRLADRIPEACKP